MIQEEFIPLTKKMAMREIANFYKFKNIRHIDMQTQTVFDFSAEEGPSYEVRLFISKN